MASAVIALTSCSDRPTAPVRSAAGRASDVAPSSDDIVTPQLVRQLATARGMVPLPPPPPVRPALARLGQALAFDKILSGNRNIACTTCHLPKFETGDGKSLSVGEGGVGLGPPREHPNGVFIPRNAPSFFNLYAMRHLFLDGRVQIDAQHRFHTPAGAQLTSEMQQVLEYGPVSALAMFPVTSRIEMRGAPGTDLGNLADDDFTGIWAGLMKRLGAIPEYRALFEAAYPGTRFDNMTFAHAANAIGAFITDQFSFRNTPWDRFLNGDDGALTARQLVGAQTFLSLKCSICHNGAMLSDEQFHNVAVPQIGPGEGNGVSTHDDFGRMNVTGDPADLYRFRTSPLRNIELTGPYGHDGAFIALRDFVAHYSESDQSLTTYDPTQLELALRSTLQPTASAILANRDPLLDGVVLAPDVVDKLMDYLQALTDDAARDLSRSVPVRVPSKLPVDHP
ncbi:MAG TPA: cytochrome c peroxidase [Gemmatimonadaceae bacterium]|nr:cytochrome c peroxidase [Gemmatimonadaceae bacterium]